MSDTPSRYRILESLGRGGMGEVFLADDTQLERKVAIKFLPGDLQDDPVAQGRFEREAKSAAALDHPYICKVYEFTEIEGRAAIVMEYVAGRTLESQLTEGAVAPAQAIQIAAEVTEALSVAHARRILHRDLKPGNLILTGQGHVKVMDFGLAKRMRDPGVRDGEDSTAHNLTLTGTLVGTPAYMAPEQVRGESVDARSDIWSFGVVLFELLTGKHPFKRGTVNDTIAAILRDAPTGADGGDGIEYAIFDRLLAKAPNDRYQSFEDVSVEVRRLRGVMSGWGAIPQRHPGMGAIGTRRTPFVGREDERAELVRCLDRAALGRGGMVLIGGEPGVGKTRLVEQVLEAAQQRGCLSVTGRCYEVEGTAPFIPFVEIIEQYARVVPLDVLRETLGDAAPEVARLVPDLRRLIPDIPPVLELPPEQQRHYLFKNVGEFVERVSRVNSLVLLLDDLQWADHATLLLLQHLAPLLGELPVLALGTYRDVELDVNRPFAATLEVLKRKRLAQRLNLERLPQEDVAGMLAAMGGPSPPEALVTGVYRETEGNPFFVEEVYQDLQEEGVLHRDDGTWRPDLDVEERDVPEGVRLVIGRRLERVSTGSRKVLTLGAVVGRSFSLPLLESLGDVTGDTLLAALEEAEAAHLIVGVPGREPRWEFSHAVIRQTLAGTLSLPRRQQLHRRIAEAIEATTDDAIETRAAELAHHLYQAGTAVDASKTVSVLQRAAGQAQLQGAFDEALKLLDKALSLVQDSELAVRATLLLTRGTALQSLAQSERALIDLEQAVTLYEQVEDIEGAARASWVFAFLCAWRADNARGISVARRGLAMVGERPGNTRCRLLAAAAFVLGAAGEVNEAHRLIATAVAEAESLDDTRLLGQLLNFNALIGFASMAGREWAMVGERSAVG